MKIAGAASIAKMNVLAILLGFFATLFLSTGFIVNSFLAFKGGFWAWTVALRYLFLLPPLLILISIQKRFIPFIRSFRSMPLPFLLWGTIGFIVFYALLVLSVRFIPGWLSCAAFQFTIVAGRLIAPFIYNDTRRKIPRLPMLMSLIIIMGVAIMHFDQLQGLSDYSSLFSGFLLALAASFLWPLGLRKMMMEVETRGKRFTSLEISFGMAIGAAPAALILSLVGFLHDGFPPLSQVESCLGSAIFAGVIGTGLFVKALSMVKKSSLATAAVEATQVAGIWFTLLAEIIIKGLAWPGTYANIGFTVAGAVLIGYMVMAVSPRSRMSLT